MGQGAMLDFILIKGQKPFHDERKYYLASAGIHRNKLIFWRMTASSAAVSCFSILRENKDPMKNIKAGNAIPTSKSSHDTLQGLLTHGLVLINNSVKKGIARETSRATYPKRSIAASVEGIVGGW